MKKDIDITSPEHPLSYTKVMAAYQEARSERVEWESDWRMITEYLTPGRGIYQVYSKPRKRSLTTKKVINTIGEDALYVLTSGMHSGLTSPSRPWFKLDWADDNIKGFEPLKAWLQDCEKRLNAALHQSNFYSIINSFYIEYAGYGTGSMYVGEDSNTDSNPFRFELLTAGEYAFAVGADGRAEVFFRTIIKTPRQVVESYPDKASKSCKDIVSNNKAGIDVANVILVEYTVRRPHGVMPFTKVVYEVASGNSASRAVQNSTPNEPLEVRGFYEFPYPIARWGTIGSDIYGIGPGSRAIPHIRRLQEMEKSFLMATHKTIAPPLNIPARMRGKSNTMPGGLNYYSNPNEVITPVMQVRFDFQGVSAAIERVEQRIQRNFFNDIFLTASRDPNASPLKATQVNVQEQEKMLRLGPVIERLQHEFLQPVIERCFNIMLRKERFQPLSPELAEIAGDYSISMISPLATAQRGIAMNGINSFMGFVGQAAQFDQTILDNINVDEAAREMADISGVALGVLRPQSEVEDLRRKRAQAQAQQQKAEQQAQVAQLQSGVDVQDATTRKTAAEAGQINMETQQLAQELGML